jgi:hypothetical protein
MLKKTARKWWVKVIIQKILSFLPHKFSLKINEYITFKIRGEQRFNVSKRFSKGFENIELINQKANLNIQNKVILEVGTGWHGIDLIIFYLLGAKKIYTIDRYPYLTIDNLKKSIVKFDQLSQYHDEIIKKRYAYLLKILKKSNSLKSFLYKINCEYLIKKPDEYSDLFFQEPIDLFYSESVLQRIPEKNLDSLITKASESMTREAAFFHRTDQKDINSQNHVDQGYWGLRYLRYNRMIYDIFINSKLNSQNRLRESDFLGKFKQYNLYPIYIQSIYREIDLELIKDVSLSKDFIGYNDLDLCIRASKIVGIKIKENNINPEREYISY